VITVSSLVSRPVAAGQLDAAAGPRDALFSIDWIPLPATAPVPAAAVIGGDDLGLAAALTAAGTDARAYPDLAGLTTAGPVPETVLALAGSADTTGGSGAAAEAGRVLGLVQQWLGDERLAGSRLVVVTRGAVAAGPGEGVADLAGAACWGLVRSAQSENPGRLVLADLPAAGMAGAGMTAAAAVLATGLGAGEPEVAVRAGTVLGRRLGRPAAGLAVPDGPWRLEPGPDGTLEQLTAAQYPAAAGPLEAGQVRVQVRAAGLNFRDVLIGLGMYPGAAVMGSEIAGTVTETGPGVTGLTAGDRVMGMAGGGFGPVTVTDARTLAKMPAGWGYARAAAVPVAYMTAWYALCDLGAARPGQKLLVHAAAGGVGTAAVTIARHLGLEVYATASPGKHPVLRAMGLDDDHIASSRDAGFEGKFLAATGGTGMDLVLNALAGELTDASLRLLPCGGMFLEMGKTDIRDPARVAADHAGVVYRAFDLSEAGPDRSGQILGEVTGLLAAGELAAAPVACWDIRRAREAMRFMSQARHTGKIVLTLPAAAPAPGTVLVTGGTGMLGGLLARHLAGTGRAAALVLASRSGPAAPGAAGLAAAVAGAGAGVSIVAADTADRGQAAAVIAGAGTRLTGVVHAAGVLDDGIVTALTPERIAAVMAPKAAAAWHLHQLTTGMDLEWFTLFSSAAATFGSPGQGNYAAANAFLDGLAAARRSAGLPAQSLAWGLWAGQDGTSGGMGGQLSQGDQSRVARGGMTALTAADGLALLETALARDEAVLVPARIDIPGLRARAAGTEVPPLWRGLAGAPARRTAGAGGDGDGALRRQLAGLPGPDRDRLVLDLVRAHAAAVLGHPSPEAVQPARAFTDLGLDSLTAVELRNRLAAATGLRLPATLIFDYPAPAALANYLREELSPDIGSETNSDEDKFRKALATVPLSRFREAGLMEALLRLADINDGVLVSGSNGKAEVIDTLDAESLVRMALGSEETNS
jgi:NADPH:quinone reductase-like Zn-dependent oxidoreductase/acyl carrier protein